MNITDPKLIQMLGEVKQFPKRKKEDSQKVEIEKITLTPSQELLRVYEVYEPLVEILNNAKEEAKKDSSKKHYNIEHQFRHEESLLENMKRDRLKLLEDDTEKQIKEIEDKTNKCFENIELVHKIKYLLECKNKKVEFDKTKINERKGKNLIDEYEDDCILLHAYIVPNSRPINKFTLSIVGFCKFGNSRYNTLGKKILELPDDYGDIDTFGSGINIKKDIGHYPSELEAVNYIQSMGIKRAMSSFFTEYNKAKIFYEKVNEFYNIADFTNIELPKEDW